MMANLILKNTIKVERAKKDLTQEGLAQLVGVTRKTINSIERGNYVPSTFLALKIVRVFHARFEDVFFLIEE
jgi:putative transcriptional regulator